MNAPLSQRLRCLFNGHDWRTAIGPRDGYFERCRRCYATRTLPEQAHVHDASGSERAA